MTKARDLGDNALNTKPKVVDAKGDLIVGTAADTADRLAVGSNGDSLVADSTATTGLRWASTPSASNPVINSAFDIWQRGTSDFTPLNASFVYTADRWSCFRSAGSSGALVKYVSSTGLAGIPNAARMQRTSGNTSTDGLYLLHNLETRDSTRFQGKTVTMSFYARAGANFSGSNSNIAFFMYSGTGTDLGGFSSGWTGAAAIVDTTSATLTTSWARYTATGTVSSSANQIGMVFYYAGVGTAGANDYFDITGVQIDVGNVALPYRRTSANLQGELAACQRYYYRITEFQIAGGTQSAAENKVFFALNSINAVPMRTTPTAAFESTPYVTNGASNLRTVTAVAVASKAMIGFTYDSTRLTDSYSYMINAADAGRAVSLSAELQNDKL